MLLNWMQGLRNGWHMAPDEGGGGTETVEAPQETVETPDETPEETPEETAEETVEETTEDETPEETPDDTPEKPAPKASAPASAKPIPKSVPYDRFQELNKKFRDMEAKVAELTRVPETDALDDLLTTLPKGEDGSDERALYDNVKDFAPVVKSMRMAILAPVANVVTGMLRAMDKMSFINQQLMDSLVEKDAEGTIVKDNRPMGLKNLDRVSAIRDEVARRSGGKTIIRHADAFEELQEQLRTEEEQRSVKQSEEGRIRADERARTERTATQRKQASRSTGPGSVAPVPKSSQGKRRMSYDEIEASNAAL